MSNERLVIGVALLLALIVAIMGLIFGWPVPGLKDAS